MPSRHLLAALGRLGAPPLMIAALASCFAEIDDGLLVSDAGADAVALEGSAAASDASGLDAQPNTADGAYLGVGCGDGAACIAPSSVCCSATFGDTDHRRGACFTPDDCPSGDFFECENAHDCTYPAAAGPRCCVVRLSGGAFTQTKCTDTCTQGELCDVDHPCGGGKACRASPEFPALFDCQ